MASRLLSCVVALSVALMSSAAMAAKDSGKTKKEPAPVKKSEPSDWTFVPGIFYGNKMLDSKDWADMKTQAETGVDVAIQNAEWPIVLVAGYANSVESGKDIAGIKAKGDTTEIRLGVRYGIDNDNENLRFFVGGGLAQISGKGSYTDAATGEYLKFSGSTIGHWLGAGLDYMVTDTISVGAEARYSAGVVKAKFKADTIDTGYVESDDIGYEMGGTHLGVTLRYHPE